MRCTVRTRVCGVGLCVLAGSGECVILVLIDILAQSRNHVDAPNVCCALHESSVYLDGTTCADRGVARRTLFHRVKAKLPMCSGEFSILASPDMIAYCWICAETSQMHREDCTQASALYCAADAPGWRRGDGARGERIDVAMVPFLLRRTGVAFVCLAGDAGGRTASYGLFATHSASRRRAVFKVRLKHAFC